MCLHMQGDGTIVVKKVVLIFWSLFDKIMDLRSSHTVDKLYKDNAIVFLQSQAIRSNDYDCLKNNNIEMFEVTKNCAKTASAMMVFSKVFFKSIVYTCHLWWYRLEWCRIH